MHIKNILVITLILLSSITITSFKWIQEKDNTLTDSEKKDGWRLLFDGTTTKGWKMYRNISADGWKVVNGELISMTNGVTRRADLVTTDQYDNFELTVDWKVGKGANSGIVYRVLETDRPSHESGPEYQIIDDNGYALKLEDCKKAGRIMPCMPPLSSWQKLWENIIAQGSWLIKVM